MTYIPNTYHELKDNLTYHIKKRYDKRPVELVDKESRNYCGQPDTLEDRERLEKERVEIKRELEKNGKGTLT